MSEVSATPSLGRGFSVQYTGANDSKGGNTTLIIVLVLFFVIMCSSICSSLSLGGGAYAYSQQEDAESFANQYRYRGSLRI